MSNQTAFLLQLLEDQLWAEANQQTITNLYFISAQNKTIHDSVHRLNFHFLSCHCNSSSSYWEIGNIVWLISITNGSRESQQVNHSSQSNPLADETHLILWFAYCHQLPWMDPHQPSNRSRQRVFGGLFSVFRRICSSEEEEDVTGFSCMHNFCVMVCLIIMGFVNRIIPIIEQHRTSAAICTVWKRLRRFKVSWPAQPQRPKHEIRLWFSSTKWLWFWDRSADSS